MTLRLSGGLCVEKVTQYFLIKETEHALREQITTFGYKRGQKGQRSVFIHAICRTKETWENLKKQTCICQIHRI